MATNLFVTAIMPTRSRPALSWTALRCFLGQTYEPRELVILDDEDDPSFIDAPLEPGVRYFRKPRMLLGAKRNWLCGAATGECIVHWDSDDWSAPGRMKHQVECMLAARYPFGGYNALLFWDERSNIGYRWTGPTGYACGASLCYRKDFWACNPFPNIDVAEDNAMVLSAQAAGGVSSADGAQWLIARVHGRNTSSAQRIGQNNWPIVARSEFPDEFFEAIRV